MVIFKDQKYLIEAEGLGDPNNNIGLKIDVGLRFENEIEGYNLNFYIGSKTKDKNHFINNIVVFEMTIDNYTKDGDYPKNVDFYQLGTLGADEIMVYECEDISKNINEFRNKVLRKLENFNLIHID